MSLDPKDIKYGLIAYNPIKETVPHFVGYWNEPTELDAAALLEELKTNPEFGLIEEADQLVILRAPEWLLKEIVSDIDSDSNDITIHE
jgi:hypothetical protein